MENELDYKKLGLKIREMRKLRKLSQEQLSEAIGISSNYLSRVETSNGGVISLPTLLKICNVLGTSMDYMLSDSLRLTRTDSPSAGTLSDEDKQFIEAVTRELIKYKHNMHIEKAKRMR